LLQHRLVDIEVLMKRIAMLDRAHHDLTHITQWTQRRAQEASNL
jgi:hypothetical protein